MRYYGKRVFKRLLDIASRNVTGIITGVITEEAVASLTFDDGPDPVYTPKVLEILRYYGVHATFFMVGEGAHNYPDIVKLVAQDGHAIGNHSWSHCAFPSVGLKKRWEEIRKCQQAIRPYGERLFRPPFGLINKRSAIEISLHGYRIIGWSPSVEDWCESNSEAMADKLEKNTKAGSIILLHDRLFIWTKAERGAAEKEGRIVDREPMLFALRKFLERLSGSIQFVTIPALLRSGRPESRLD